MMMMIMIMMMMMIIITMIITKIEKFIQKKSSSYNFYLQILVYFKTDKYISDLP